jgi:hypothetical protein
MRNRAAWPSVLGIALACACSKSSGGQPPSGEATVVSFDSSADLRSPAHFFDFPWPSDLRLTASGAPDVTGLPNPLSSDVIEGLRAIAMDRAGYPVMPVAWFHWSAPLAPRDPTQVIPADKGSPILLVDVDPKSATPGALFPTIAQTLSSDDYMPQGNVLAVGARPGFTLAPKHQYAFVVRREANDAAGEMLGVAPAFSALVANPSASDPVTRSFAPLWPALKAAGVDPGDVAAATVFTTGDVVADLADLSSKVLAQYTADVTGLAVDPKVLDTNDRFCELQGQITFPQFQSGAPPYDTGGLFTIGADGLPTKQSDMAVPVTITLPKRAMPAGGFPVIQYFHGTGGRSTAIADRGLWHPEPNAANCPDGEQDSWNGVTGCNTAGQGPGWVMAARGFAMIASALPVNPQRWPGGVGRPFPEYFNVNNVAATRDIFRQGVIEQRMLAAALPRVQIAPSAVAACTGLSLPSGETAYHFATSPLFAQGQSMGAMYANLISAVEPSIKAVVATGAGGYWSYFILLTSTIPGIKSKLQILLDTPNDYSHLHPVMHLAQLGLDPIDPIASMPRLGYDPLPNHPTRPIYEPHGMGDSYFPTVVQDAVALAYRNKEAGDVVWPTMQDALRVAGLSGLVPYPVANEVTSTAGAPYTGVVVQYQGDGVYDPHAIYTQLDAVKYQYGCFFETMLATGKATVPAPADYSVKCAGE